MLPTPAAGSRRTHVAIRGAGSQTAREKNATCGQRSGSEDCIRTLFLSYQLHRHVSYPAVRPALGAATNTYSHSDGWVASAWPRAGAGG